MIPRRSQDSGVTQSLQHVLVLPQGLLGTCPRHLSREAARGHPIQMPEPHQLAPLYVLEQWLYSEHLSGERASHPVSKGAPLHPAGWLLVFWSLLKVHDHRWGWERGLTAKSRAAPFGTAPSFSLTLHPSLLHEQNPQILKILKTG